MTDEIERKWLDEAARLAGWEDWADACEYSGTLRRAISAHARTLRDFDAFRREVSEELRGYFITEQYPRRFYRFILPAPPKDTTP